MSSIDESDLQALARLHTRDVISLVAVLKRIKHAATLVIPLEVGDQIQGFCERNDLIHFEDGPSDSYQMRITVCYDKETGTLKRKLDEIRSVFDDVRKNPIVSNMKRACSEFMKAVTRLEGRMYGYPECCIDLHAEKGPSSRARAYEEFLESGRDQSIPIEFWAVAHAPCGSTCKRTLDLGRKYLDAVGEFSGGLRDHVESSLRLSRFYQTGGGRFIDLIPLDYEQRRNELSISKEQFKEDARSRLLEPVEIVLCDVPRPYVLVDAVEEPPYKTSFPSPDMIGTMWLAYTPGVGVYMIDAKTGRLALYILSGKWIPKVGEQWRSRSNFRIYRSIQEASAQKGSTKIRDDPTHCEFQQ